jgi:hypothetical protein
MGLQPESGAGTLWRDEDQHLLGLLTGTSASTGVTRRDIPLEESAFRHRSSRHCAIDQQECVRSDQFTSTSEKLPD